jgi:hypothetical protein
MYRIETLRPCSASRNLSYCISLTFECVYCFDFKYLSPASLGFDFIFFLFAFTLAISSLSRNLGLQ